VTNWMPTAWGELDVAEFPGDANNPKIVAYHATTKGGPSPDDVSWCSSYVNWCVIQAGHTGTNSKAARSWLGWGVSCEQAYGVITVLWRVDPKDWRGHVGFWVGSDEHNVYLLNGNSSNRVRVTRHAKSRVLGYRTARA
jgi:uncharacterized protein (TIGR02594 family)